MRSSYPQNYSLKNECFKVQKTQGLLLRDHPIFFFSLLAWKNFRFKKGDDFLRNNQMSLECGEFNWVVLLF